ncbi:MAG: lytic transglycosylase domain-containing protein [Lagierella massiliensis]|nr:lytic transglycosylase domain-containing protein [Lagierella massiliensis]
MKKFFKGLLKFIVALLIVILLASFAVVGYGTMTRPVEYVEEINKYSQEYNVDPLLVLSVIKVESNFNPSATSHMNAVGLMQLIPKTSQWISEKMGIEYSDEILQDPQTNIQLGTYYLSYLLNHFGDTDLAIIAYNGGMGNVQKWLDDGLIGKGGEGFENIPIDEARYYDIKVKKNYEIYKTFYQGEELENGMHDRPKVWLDNYFRQIKEFLRDF